MKLVVDGTEYDIWDSVNFATLGDLDDLQEQSSTAKFDGVTDPYIRDAWKLGAELVESGKSLRESQQFRRAIMGILFLAKRRVGEDVSWADVRKIPYVDAKLVFTEQELAVEDGPKESGAAESPEPN